MNKRIKKAKKEVWMISAIIMLTIIIIGLISLSSFLKETAWIYLGFAGTTASLVLSVLAIIITLVDVAGQKQQVYDISNSARQLKN
ncbi:hypothetical protein DWB90_08830 [Staphylococcus chromogenes]|nr:hypothetical protein DWB90_08830 [Staphylococcus chromogenes]